jgi:hypothetical protein
VQELGGLGGNAIFLGKEKNRPMHFHALLCTYLCTFKNKSAALKNGPKMGMQMGAFYLYTIKNAHTYY